MSRLREWVEVKKAGWSNVATKLKDSMTKFSIKEAVCLENNLKAM